MKILSLFLSCFLIFSNISSSFASPLVLAPISISYNSLMALMGIGVAFGVSLPQTDEEYYDYTKSLRNHLHLVDEDYLEKLDKIVSGWDSNNNNNKPEEEEEKLKVPYIPGLEQLFKNVGNDVSKEYEYVGDLINCVPVRKYLQNELEFVNSINLYPISLDSVVSFGTPNGDIHYKFEKGSSYYYLKYSYDNSNWTTVKSINSKTYVDNTVAVSPVYNYNYTDDSGMPLLSTAYTYKTDNTYSGVASNISSKKYLPLNTLVYPKPSIDYSPTLPNIENDELVIPSMPEITVPNIESLPNYNENMIPPFEVVSPGDNPGDDPGDDPGDSLFPNKSSITDYIVGLVVPSNDFWTNSWNDLYNNFTSSFPMVDMSGFDSLVTGEKKFPNIDISIMGITGRVVNGDVINSIVDWLRPIIAGFVMICLMLFNYRKIYKLIRNSEPFEGIGKVENHAN